MLGVGARHTHRKNIHRPTGPEPALSLARGVAQRAALDLGMPIHPLALTDGMQLRIKPHDGATGHWPEIVRPQHVQQGMRQLGKLVLDLLTELPRQKGETFQQPFNIRVGTLLRKKPGQLRMRIRKLSALQPEKTQFVPVKSIQLHNDYYTKVRPRGWGYLFCREKGVRAKRVLFPRRKGIAIASDSEQGCSQASNRRCKPIHGRLGSTIQGSEHFWVGLPTDAGKAWEVCLSFRKPQNRTFPASISVTSSEVNRV